jgi:hypothetical protein
MFLQIKVILDGPPLPRGSNVTVTILPVSYPLAVVSMSQIPPTPPSKFSAIFCASIKEYERKTMKDLITHPLMAQLQTCNSPTDILAVLRTQVQQSEQSTRGDDKLTKWLNPTVNVLYAFSSTLGAGVGLVNSFLKILHLRSNL